MQISLSDIDQGRRARRFAVYLELGQFCIVGDNPRPAVQPDRFIYAGNQKNQADFGVRHHVRQGIEPVVPRAVRNHDCVRVDDLNKPRCITARAHIGAAVRMVGADD